MQLSRVEDVVVVLVEKEGPNGLDLLDLRPTAGGIARSQVGLVDDPGAPCAALGGAFPGPPSPAVAGDQYVEVLAEGPQGGAPGRWPYVSRR